MEAKCERCGKSDLKLIGHNEHGPVQWCEHCGTIHDCYGRRTPDVAYAFARVSDTP